VGQLLSQRLKATGGGRSPWAAVWLANAVLLLAVAVLMIVNNSQAVAEGFRQTLQW
jgi:hypothetical protein